LEPSASPPKKFLAVVSIIREPGGCRDVYGRCFMVRRSKAADWGVEMASVGVAVYLVVLFAPGLSSVLESIAFRIRAAGKAELVRAGQESGVPTRRGRKGKQGRHG
jgi:hypothetical protein